jgi:phosphopantetheine adenylyltransferase
MTGETYAFTSSSLIKQIAAGGDVDSLHLLLPPLVLDRLKEKKNSLGSAFSNLREDGFTE